MNCLVNYKIINNDETIIKNNINAIYKDNELIYTDENDSIKLIINNDNIIMIKDNLTSKTTLHFINNKKTESEYFIKILNNKVDLKVNTKKLEIEKEKIYIEYEIFFDEESTGNFIYEINIKEV